MTKVLLALSILSVAPVLVAGAARAQAVEPAEPAAPAAAELAPAPPSAVAPCVVARPDRAPVMANRWSIGLSFGNMNLKPDGATDPTSFGVGELALRYRLTPHLELEVSAGGGRERLDGGMQGDLQVSTVAGAARYRFNPDGAWNWFVMGGVGAAAVTYHDASDQQRQDATHPMAMLGAGVERRFAHFALQAELRGIGIAARRDDREMAAAVTGAPPTTDAADVKQSGGEVTVGGSWYF